MRAILLVVLLSGCIRWTAAPPARGRTAPPFTYAHARGNGYSLAPLERESDAYAISLLSFPAADRSDPKNPTVRAELRRPPRVRGLVIILPILGGDYGASNVFAQHFAELGFATLRFDRREDVFDPEKDWAHVARSIENGVIDVRRSLDWPVLRDMAKRGVGIMGISMGSFVATGVAATDPRVDAAVLALGGAGLVEIVRSASSEWEIAQFLEGLRKRGWSEERIWIEAHQHLDPIDPERFAGALDPRSTLMVHARFDTVVPYENGTRLWEAAGKPPRVTLMSGHYTAALYLPWLLSISGDHFLRHLR